MGYNAFARTAEQRSAFRRSYFGPALPARFKTQIDEIIDGDRAGGLKKILKRPAAIKCKTLDRRRLENLGRTA